MNHVFLGLGANIGNAIATFEYVIERLAGINEILQISSIYQTSPWGVTHQPDYFNAVLELLCNQSPFELLQEIQALENELGRVRSERWQARTIDIDILYFGTQIIQTDNLVVPHPLLHLRKFVLIPLSEIAPTYLHPVLGKTTQALVATCPDEALIHQLFVQGWRTCLRKKDETTGSKKT